MVKKCIIKPLKNRFIPGILPNRKRITMETELELTIHQVKRCMSNAVVTHITEDGNEVIMDELNWNKDTESYKYTSIPSKIGTAKVGSTMVL